MCNMLLHWSVVMVVVKRFKSAVYPVHLYVASLLVSILFREKQYFSITDSFVTNCIVI